MPWTENKSWRRFAVVICSTEVFFLLYTISELRKFLRPSPNIISCKRREIVQAQNNWVWNNNFYAPKVWTKIPLPFVGARLSELRKIFLRSLNSALSEQRAELWKLFTPTETLSKTPTGVIDLTDTALWFRPARASGPIFLQKYRRVYSPLPAKT